MPSDTSLVINQVFETIAFPSMECHCGRCGVLSRTIRYIEIDRVVKPTCLHCFTDFIIHRGSTSDAEIEGACCITCERCGCLEHPRHIRPLNLSFVCEACSEEEERPHYCTYCDRSISDEDSTTVLSADGYTQVLCGVCYDSCRHLIHDYSYTPDPIYYKTDRDIRTNLYYGIELEVEYLGDNTMLEGIETMPDCVYLKSDSSITRGFEIVSHPMTYNWLQDNANIWEGILALKEKDYRSFNTATCGMHIHLSKAGFNWAHLYKFMYFIYNPYNATPITQLSQRSYSSLARWAEINSSDKRIIEKAISRMENGDRHTAVALARAHTVELRIFRGTLDSGVFWKNVEFAQALYDFSSSYSIRDMVWEVFVEFVSSEYNTYRRYKHLYKFLNNDPHYSSTTLIRC